MDTLHRRTALVTGGGTGIGAAIAPTRVQERPSRWSAVGSRRSTPSSRRSPRRAAARSRPGDVTDLEQMKNAASAAVEAFGHIDLVVANAGAAPPMGEVLDADEASWRAIVDLNLTGVWITAKATVPRTRGARQRHVRHHRIGCRTANSGGLGSYSAAKAGASALTRVLAAKLRPHRIAVNEIVPGPVYTEAIPIFGGGTEDKVAGTGP